MALLLILMVLLASFDVLVQNAFAAVLPIVTVVSMLPVVVLVILTVRSRIQLRFLLIFAVLFAILFETMYSHSSFIFVVGYVIAILLTKGLTKIVNQPFITTLLATIVSIVLVQTIGFSYYFAMYQLDIMTFVTEQLFATLVFNSVAMLILYPIVEVILQEYHLTKDNKML